MVCCSKVVKKDLVVCLCKERILVPNFLTGKGKTREETVITVNWAADGVDCYRVGFLLWMYALNGANYDVVHCQVMEVFGNNDPSCTICEKWHKNEGCVHVAVICVRQVNSALNKCIHCKGGGETAAVGGVKGDYFS